MLLPDTVDQIYSNFKTALKEECDNEDVTIEKGAVSKFTTKGGTNVIVNSAQISRGNSGGPLVDSQGNVVGVNSYTLGTSDGGNYYYAIEIDTVREMLDALGIQYTSADGSTQGANVQEGTDATQEAGEEETTEAQPVKKEDEEKNFAPYFISYNKVNKEYQEEE